MNFDNGILINKASQKFLFIAFAFEYIKVHKAMMLDNSAYIETQLPIQLDATCNGYQHLSMLSRDDDLGKNLNLMSSRNDKVPQDFYGLLISKITTDLKEEISSCDSLSCNESTIEACKRILNFEPDRSLIKKPVMIESYNATELKSADALKDTCYCINSPEFDNINTPEGEAQAEKYDGEARRVAYSKRKFIRNKNSDPNTYLMDGDFLILVKAMKKVLQNDYPKLTKLRLYLNDIAKICNKLDLNIPWTLPTGLIVNHGYLSNKSFQIRPFDSSRKSFSLNYVYKNVFNKPKQSRALMPNLIHSLDATSLALLYKKYSVVNKSFYSIHDCFAVPAPQVETLVDLIQSVYLDIYSNHVYLKDFDDCVIRNIEKSLGIKLLIEDNNSNKTKYFVVDGKRLYYPNIDSVFTNNNDNYNLVFDALKHKKAIYAIN